MDAYTRHPAFSRRNLTTKKSTSKEGKIMNPLDALIESTMEKTTPTTTSPTLTAADTASIRAQHDVNTSRDRAITEDASDTDAYDEFHDRVVESMGFDPSLYMVSGNIKAWNSGDEVHYSAAVVKRSDFINTGDVIEDILNFDPEFLDVDTPAKQETTTGGVWKTIQVGDVHIGKSAHDGAGTRLIVERLGASIQRAIEETPDDAAGIHIAVMGDLIEGEVSQNGKNITLNDAPLTAQLRIATVLFTRIVRDAVEKVGNVIVSVVPGNHGDTNRQVARPSTENFDIFIMSQVQTTLEAIDDINADSTFSDAVKWVFPQENSMHVTYPVGDTVFTSVHGHRFGRGTGIMGKAQKWWEGHTFNGGAEAQSQVMMMGHYHTAVAQVVSHNRMIICSPAMEDKSTWFNESSGVVGMPGVMTYLTDERRRPYNMSIV